jgi:hypothetical protein
MRRALLTAVVFGVLAAPAHATDYLVNTNDDPGSPDVTCTPEPGGCTLRDALDDAGPGDRVIVPAGTYNLVVGPLDPFNDTIVGQGARSTIIDAGGVNKALEAIAGANTVSGLTLRNGGGQSQVNPAGGAVLVESFGPAVSLTLRNVTVSGSRVNGSPGGGIASVNATLTVENSTISGNVATTTIGSFGGGVVVQAGTATFRNSTISGNSAIDTDPSTPSASGGGVHVDDGTLVMQNVTVAGNVANTATGVWANGPTTLTNTVIAGSCENAPWGGSRNLSTSTTCGFGAAVNPLLGPLANNGGPTNTHALAATSSAINAGSGCSATDQRGVARDGVCDIGAFEYFRPRLTVVKQVVNDQGGTLTPGDFNVHVRVGGADVGGSPQPGTAAGRTYVLGPGTYTIGEDADDRYAATFSGACNAAGAVSLSEAEVATCTITNADKPPVAGEVVNAEPERGTVRIKLPGRRRFRVLREGEQLPVGTVVDTLNGRVTLFAAANKKGGTSESDFYDGVFKLSQTKGSKPITVLRLVERLTGCKTSKQASAAAKKKKKRRLWGNGSGRFRTRGRHSAATVVGTRWLVEDRCRSTLTRVRRGKVKVRDFVKDKTVTVKAGKKYVARKRP